MGAGYKTEQMDVLVQLESDNSCRSEGAYEEDDEGISAEDVFLA